MRIDRIKLIVLMAERDMTIGRLAELSRLSVSTICQVKAGKSCSTENRCGNRPQPWAFQQAKLNRGEGMSDVVRVDEVMTRLDCSMGKAYKIIKTLNDELKRKGYITVAGRVPRSYFEQKCLLERK